MQHKMQQSGTKRKPSEQLDPLNKELLLDALNTGDCLFLRRASQRGWDHDAHGFFGMTPVHLAASRGDEALFRFLAEEFEADVNKFSLNGTVPIHNAVFYEQASIARALVAEFGADVNAADENGRSALHIAACSGHKAMVLLLVRELGADINVVDREGRTSVVAAAHICCGPVIKELVAAGAAATRIWEDDWGSEASVQGRAAADGSRERNWAPLEKNVADALLPCLRESGVCAIVSGYAQDTLEDWVARG